jgi:hypothetical protein
MSLLEIKSGDIIKRYPNPSSDTGTLWKIVEIKENNLIVQCINRIPSRKIILVKKDFIRRWRKVK